MPVTRRIKSLATVFMLGLLSGCASEPAQPITTLPAAAPSVRYSDVRPDDLIPSREYRVWPGDVLEVSVSDIVGPGVESVKIVRVSNSGTISVPLIGQIPVAGMTEDEISEVINKAYHDFP